MFKFLQCGISVIYTEVVLTLYFEDWFYSVPVDPGFCIKIGHG